MADFVRYNGYNVKDANALAHASISGNTLTTTNREGNVVDTLTLPGGSSNISATSMAYHNKSIDQAYSLGLAGMFNGNPDMTMPYAFGQVMSDEMIGYGDISYASGLYTLGSIYAQTIRSWDTYDRTDAIGGAGHDANTNIGDTDSFEDNSSLLHRKARYRTYLCVGKSNVYTTVTAGSAKRIMTTSGDGGNLNNLPVKAPNGAVQGHANIVGVKPLLECERSGSTYTINRAGLIMYYDKTAGVIAYNATSADIRVDAFILELEVILESQYCDDRGWISVDPYIKYLNIEQPTGDAMSDIKVKTNVIVRNPAGTTDKKLFEYKLTKNSSGVWSWASSYVSIPNTDASTSYNTKMTKEHLLQNGSTFVYNDYTSAVVYAVGAGTSIVGDAFFTDALPLPMPLLISW